MRLRPMDGDLKATEPLFAGDLALDGVPHAERHRDELADFAVG